jgi:flagellar biosynthetic protein FliR
MVELSPAFTYGLLLVLIRTSALLVTSPLLSHRGIPAMTKAGFAVFFALVLVPLEKDNLPPAPEGFGTLTVAVLREALFGLALGLAMNMVFMGLQMASRIVGVQMGFGLGGVLDPITGNDGGVLEQFYMLLVTLVFFSIQGHYLVITALAETIRAVPPGTFDPFSAISSGEVGALAAGLMITAVRIAMPVMAALFLVDLGMGLVARTVPQVQVLFVAMPVKVGVGLLVLMASLPASAHLMGGVIGNSMAGTSMSLLRGA